MKNNYNGTPILLIVALIILLGVEIFSIFFSGFHLIRFILTAILIYYIFVGSNIAKRILIMLLLLSIGYAIYMVSNSGFNQQLLVLSLYFVVPYIVSISLLLFPKSVKIYFGK